MSISRAFDKLDRLSKRKRGTYGKLRGMQLEEYVCQILHSSGLFEEVYHLTQEEDAEEHIDLKVKFGGFVLKVQIKSSHFGEKKWLEKFKKKSNSVMIFKASSQIPPLNLLKKFLQEACEFLKAHYAFAADLLPTLAPD